MTTDKLHDALNLLPGDLIAATDALRQAPRKRVIPWRRYASLAACLVLVLGLGWVWHVSGRSYEKAAQTENILGALPQEAPAAATWAAGEESKMEAPAEDAVPTMSASGQRELNTITLTPTGPAPEADESSTGAEPESRPIEGCPGETPPEEPVLDLAPTQYSFTHNASHFSPKAQTVLICSRAELDAYYNTMAALFDLASFYESCRLYDEVWFQTHDLLLLRLGAESREIEYEVTGFQRAADTEGNVWYLTLTLRHGEGDWTLPDTGCFWHILMEADKGLLTETDTILIETEEIP